MKRSNLCRFCGKPLTKKDKCYVCESCKAVIYSDEVGIKEFLSGIENDIEEIQQCLDANRTCLRDIEERYTNNSLTEEESNIREISLEFQDSSSWVKAFIKDDIGISDKTFSQELYRLLEIKMAFNDVLSNENLEAKK